ncbi:hotdog domain-containing protein [Nocardia sp. NPDC057663]|uniref:hotdog domain-containing protein n=1 Tax=Nocardia sp. NPDC057663 TaxID=3346201 RepID=UPI00366F9DE1
MRFHLIDRIDSWEAGRSATGRKLTSAAETYWVSAVSGARIMPPGLVLEVACQTASWLLLLGSDFRQRAALLSVDEVCHLAAVVPGDELVVEVRVAALTGEAAVIDATVRVEGDPVLTAAGIMCALLAAENLDDPAATARMGRTLCRKELVA